MTKDIKPQIDEANEIAKSLAQEVQFDFKLTSGGSKDTLNDSQLRALLVLDGDDSVDPMPQYEGAISRLRQDVIDGDIHRDHDLEALHATLTALSRGYRIFRMPIARRMGIGARELDARVTEIVRSWLEAMAQPPAASPTTGQDKSVAGR